MSHCDTSYLCDHAAFYSVNVVLLMLMHDSSMGKIVARMIQSRQESGGLENGKEVYSLFTDYPMTD